MQVNRESAPQGLSEFGAGAGLTVTEDARRRQIIDATVETVAELGYRRTSFARIVERAGLSSTRMVSYHFANKSELMAATLGAIIDKRDAFVTARLESETAEQDLRKLLLGHLRAELAFLAGHPRESTALVEIGAHAESDGVSAQVVQAVQVGRFERQLGQGIRAGVFRELDPRVTALAMRQAVDGVTLRLRHEPDLDVEAYGRELAELFDRAIRAD
ncbi:TetR/AcrR family transcriptional regulator [Prauserella rugosa]|uniref:TetR family transcriptional regulator n=1 Tax=Prauserella rugosa TaxID=43354 RepID=A0A660CE68_9PSEU|nr:TetR/AcrR family transcriptional regulator [Prauserella rugosa]KID31376.1 transcriptional regulator, TetR family [Prauserella sp. Am3]KMS89629.1 hypothetical protein ACZ91_19435 [Streptomyces regensis]TWH19185.1 TetR family transcriptional regulator [Prauserella rugosa]